MTPFSSPPTHWGQWKGKENGARGMRSGEKTCSVLPPFFSPQLCLNNFIPEPVLVANFPRRGEQQPDFEEICLKAGLKFPRRLKSSISLYQWLPGRKSQGVALLFIEF